MNREPFEQTQPTDDGGVIVPPAVDYQPQRYEDANGDGTPDVKGASEAELVSIPPLPRTVLYYVLALANAAAVPLAAAGKLDPLWTLIILNVAAVFGFTLAANRVPKEN